MKKLLILSLFLLSISVAPVHAYWVDVEWAGSLHSEVSVTYHGSTDSFNAGLYWLDFKTDKNSTILFSNVGFCVEPGVSAWDEFGSFGDVSNDNLKKAAWLMSTQWDSSSVNPYEHTGLQLAIWAVFGVTINDNGKASFDFYDDYMKNLMAFIELDPDLSTFSSDEYQVVKMPHYQDMLIHNPVPEPATMTLFGLGLLGISALGRKKE